jgi:hypothetical protein
MRRRTFLGALGTGAAATATLPVPGLARTTAARGQQSAPKLDPGAVVDASGLSEVVVGDDGRYAFGAAWDAFLVADCADDAEPTVVADVTPTIADQPASGLQDVAVDGDRAIVAGPPGIVREDDIPGAVLFDVSDPENPEQVATIDTDHAIHNCTIDGDTAYLTGTSVPESPILTYDVSGDDPTQVGRWSVVDEVPEWGRVRSSVYQAHDVTVQNDRAYVAYWDAGTWILDVSDPANPTSVTQIGGLDPTELEDTGIGGVAQLPGNSHYALPSPDGDLLAISREAWDRDRSDDLYGGPGGIDLYDVSDEQSPTYLTTLQPPVVQNEAGENHVNTAHNLAFRERRLYTSWYTGGVRVYDVSAPAEPRTLGWWAAPDDASFWTAEPVAEGFVAPSISDPSADREANRNYALAELYRFPEPDASDADPAATMQTNSVGIPDTVPDYGLPEPGEQTDTTTSTADSGTTTGSETTAGPTTTPTDSQDDTGGIPGFGVGTAVAGATLAALHRLRGE